MKMIGNIIMIIMIAIIVTGCITIKPVNIKDHNYNEGTVNVTVIEW